MVEFISIPTTSDCIIGRLEYLSSGPTVKLSSFSFQLSGYFSICLSRAKYVIVISRQHNTIMMYNALFRDMFCLINIYLVFIVSFPKDFLKCVTSKKAYFMR